MLSPRRSTIAIDLYAKNKPLNKPNLFFLWGVCRVKSLCMTGSTEIDSTLGMLYAGTVLSLTLSLFVQHKGKSAQKKNDMILSQL